MTIKRPFAAPAALLAALVGPLSGADSSVPPGPTQAIVLQSTSSTANSGLYDYLLPLFERRSGIRVHVVASGTGQALRSARNGDGDVLLVHSKADEAQFVADGFGVQRFDVMYNDFVLVGPDDDPAAVGGADIATALRRIAAASSPFTSRGDDSGTHKRERQLWAQSGIDPVRHSGRWYREIGAGMGATLNAAVGMRSYTLTDRGSWISFQNKQDFKIHSQGDARLFNQYGVILVNPQRHAHVNHPAGQAFIDWILGAEGQRAIAAYQLDGMQLFFPNAGAPNAP